MPVPRRPSRRSAKSRERCRRGTGTPSYLPVRAGDRCPYGGCAALTGPLPWARIDRSRGGARMSAIGMDLSAQTAAAVERAGRAVVRVEGRRRGPSSGIAWSADGVIVAAHHNVEWDEDIAVGLTDGSTARANVVGRDATTDVVVLRAPLTGLVVPDWASELPKVGHLALALTRPRRT